MCLCTDNCTQASLQLVNDSYIDNGHLEIMSVCDNGWTIYNADAVCDK